MQGQVFDLFTASGGAAPMQRINQAVLTAGKGIDGDRYASGTGTFSKKLQNKPDAEVTLIEKEQVDYFNAQFDQTAGYGEFRRNIITQGVDLNALVGKRIRIGDVELLGIRLCEPCATLASAFNPLVLPHMIGRSGLRAQILQGGVINVGDVLQELPDSSR